MNGRIEIAMTAQGDDMVNVAVYHGSDRIIKTEDIILPGPRKHYDFGPGFYLTDSRQIPGELFFGDFLEMGAYREI